MIVLKNVEFSYNGIPTLKGINIEIEEGKVVAILGPNGAGKSTLLKCINGLLKPRGSIYISGLSLKELKPEEAAKLIAYVPQKSNPTFMSVFDYVLLGRKPHMGLNVGKKDMKIVENVLKMLGIERLALKKLKQLSGGELQKVVIARALAQEAKVLLLDEPTNNLDLKSQLEFMHLVKKLSLEKGITAVVVVHDVNIALRFADEFIFMKNGEIVAKGGHEIVTPELISEVYEIPVTIHKLSGVPVVIPV